MNEIDYYKTQKQRLTEFEQWASMIGRTYHGGGGGIGGVVSAKCGLTVYYQAYNGDTNYHELPESFNEELGKACMEASGQIIASVRKKLEQNVEEARKNAEAIALEILGNKQA